MMSHQFGVSPLKEEDTLHWTSLMSFPSLSMVSIPAEASSKPGPSLATHSAPVLPLSTSTSRELLSEPGVGGVGAPAAKRMPLMAHSPTLEEQAPNSPSLFLIAARPSSPPLVGPEGNDFASGAAPLVVDLSQRAAEKSMCELFTPASFLPEAVAVAVVASPPRRTLTHSMSVPILPPSPDTPPRTAPVRVQNTYITVKTKPPTVGAGRPRGRPRKKKDMEVRKKHLPPRPDSPPSPPQRSMGPPPSHGDIPTRHLSPSELLANLKGQGLWVNLTPIASRLLEGRVEDRAKIKKTVPRDQNGNPTDGMVVYRLPVSPMVSKAVAGGGPIPPSVRWKAHRFYCNDLMYVVIFAVLQLPRTWAQTRRVFSFCGECGYSGRDVYAVVQHMALHLYDVLKEDIGATKREYRVNGVTWNF